MLTKNFYSYIKSSFNAGDGTAIFKLPNGNILTSYITTGHKPPFSVMNVWAKQVDNYGVSFGTGTTPATASDYCLESILGTTQISVTVPSAVTFSRGDTFDEYSVTFGITNITTEAITISEAGLTAMPFKGNPNHYALVDRTVLDTPVTIPAGQSKQITYTIRFNYGDAV